jgi:antirestriction protein ArdC
MLPVPVAEFSAMSRHKAPPRSGKDRTNLYDEITTKIIGELEAGRVPWVQPWRTAAAKAPLAMPTNAATGRSYSGINILILWGAVIELDLPGKCGEHQLRNQEVFYGKREQTDAGVSA